MGTHGLFKYCPKKPSLKGMSADMQIADRGWLSEATDRKSCATQITAHPTIVFEKLDHRLVRAVFNDPDPCGHFLVVRFQRSHSGVVRLAGFWNRWIRQLHDATVENLGRLKRTSQQYRSGPPGFNAEPDCCFD